MSKHRFRNSGPRTDVKRADNSRSGGKQNLLPGLKPVLEILRDQPEQVDAVFIKKGRHGAEGDEVIDCCRAAGVRFSLLDEAAMRRVYSGPSQGVVARLFDAGFKSLEEVVSEVASAPLPLVIALDHVLDPGNAGTLIRTLFALGGAGLIIPRHQSAYLGGAAAKSAAGAMQRLPIAKVANLSQALDKLEEAGFSVYGAAAGPQAKSVYDFQPDFPAVLVLGGEEEGIRAGVAKRCRVMLEVPMRREFDSMNVAQAGAIIVAFMGSKFK